MRVESGHQLGEYDADAARGRRESNGPVKFGLTAVTRQQKNRFLAEKVAAFLMT